MKRREVGNPRSGNGDRRPYLRFAGMGLELGAAIVGCTLVGVWIDYHFHTRPVGILVGVAVGIVGGLYNFVRDALRLSRAAQGRERPEDSRQRHDSHEQP